MFVIILVVLLVFATLFLLALALFYKDPGRAQVEQRIETALARPLTPDEKVARAKKKIQERRKEPSPLLTWASKTFGRWINRFMPSTMIQDLEGKILMAGYRNIKVTDILAIKGALPLVAILVAAFIFSPKGQFTFAVAGKSLFLSLLMVAFAFFLPDLFLSQKIGERHKEILKALPFSIDIIKICVEAGLDLEGAFARVVGKAKGAFVEELERVLYEVRMGKERVAALTDMAKRVGLADLSAFVTVMVQAEKLGMSIGKVLDIQANEMRIKQSQRAREQAAKVPVLMMIPMVLFILPAMFVVILGPAMIQIMKTLTAGGGL
jgi:tight adherence protein C